MKTNKILLCMTIMIVMTFTACLQVNTQAPEQSETANVEANTSSFADTSLPSDRDVSSNSLSEDITYIDEESPYILPSLTFDTSDLEEITPEYEYMYDSTVYYSFDVLSPTLYSEEAILAQIQMLNSDVITLENITEADEYTALLNCPSWLVVYTVGENEDTRECFDIYVQTDNADYRVHVAVPLDFSTDYHDSIFSRLSTLYWVYG